MVVAGLGRAGLESGESREARARRGGAESGRDTAHNRFRPSSVSVELREKSNMGLQQSSSWSPKVGGGSPPL